MLKYQFPYPFYFKSEKAAAYTYDTKFCSLFISCIVLTVSLLCNCRISISQYSHSSIKMNLGDCTTHCNRKSDAYSRRDKQPCPLISQLRLG